jgi:predicted nucleic acid-binding protein
MRRIFVDSWGWCAMVNRREEYHELVQDLIAELVEESTKFYTSNFVLDETYTLIRTLVHHRAAVEFHRKLQIMIAGTLVEVIYLTPEIERNAWIIFERYVDKEFSLKGY